MPETDKAPSPAFDESKYRLLLESLTDYAIYMLNVDGVVTSWNAGARRLKGYDAHEIVGRHFSLFYNDADREARAPMK